ncbi:MAG: cytochrome b/b6 domain-containing protein [Formivibrio sp.]|nr:cytochrome b/b6 domain-containing protein [Formivibrio sp.]
MNKIRVWDPLVRILHWTLVICVMSNLMNESGHFAHRTLGLIASGVVIVRFFWGFVGPRYARFSDWFPTPSRLIPYVKALLRNEAPRHIGHNPAGAVMMLILMALVVSLGTSGYLMTTDTFYGDEWLQGLHEGLANILIGSVVLHVAAALYESWKHGENLIASMLHGKKPRHSINKPQDETAAR